MLNVDMLSVIVLIVIILSVILSVIKHSVSMLSGIIFWKNPKLEWNALRLVTRL